MLPEDQLDLLSTISDLVDAKDEKRELLISGLKRFLSAQVQDVTIDPSEKYYYLRIVLKTRLRRVRK